MPLPPPPPLFVFSNRKFIDRQVMSRNTGVEKRLNFSYRENFSFYVLLCSKLGLKERKMNEFSHTTRIVLKKRGVCKVS